MMYMCSVTDKYSLLKGLCIYMYFLYLSRLYDKYENMFDMYVECHDDYVMFTIYNTLFSC